MSTVERRLPSVEQLRLDAERGRFVDRIEEYLPETLYRARKPGNGRARKGTIGGRARPRARRHEEAPDRP